jgi:ribokinase
MPGFDVVVLNSHGVGQYANTEKMPEWGETLRVTNWHIDQDGGKGTNVSVALGRLGLKTAYIGKVGRDPWGDLGEKWMNDAGVDTTYLYRSDEVATGTGLILIGPDGQNTIIDGDSSSVALTLEEVKSALKAMADSRLLITGFEIPEEIAQEGARYAKDLGIVTVLNPSPLPQKFLGKLDYIDFLFLNEVEGRFILGLPRDTTCSPGEIVRQIRDRYQCRTVIMTLGAKGAIGLDQESSWEVPPLSVEKVVNSAGAGDGFLAASMAKWLMGNDIRASTRWAAGYSALSVTIQGTIPAYRPLAEVEAFIASRTR